MIFLKDGNNIIKLLKVLNIHPNTTIGLICIVDGFKTNQYAWSEIKRFTVLIIVLII